MEATIWIVAVSVILAITLLATIWWLERSRRRLENRLLQAQRQAGEFDNRLQEIEADLEIVGQAAPVSLVLLDSQGRVRWANSSAQQTFLLESGRAFPPLPLERPLSELMSWDPSQTVAGLSLSWETKNLILHISPLPTEAGGGAALAFEDITEVQRLRRVRQDFVANISHELRTPMASLKLLVEALRRDEISKNQERLLGQIETEIEIMDRLTNELLELAQLESGRAPLRLELLSLSTLTQEALTALAPQAEVKGLKVGIEIPVDLNLLADRNLAHKLIINLLHNAIKFTPPGGSIRVSAAPKDGMVEVLVEDSGMGIPKEELPRIFERFYKAKDRSGSEGVGVGLGLALAKHIVEAHSGRIWAESVEGKGSTFHFTLPAP